MITPTISFTEYDRQILSMMRISLAPDLRDDLPQPEQYIRITEVYPEPKDTSAIRGMMFGLAWMGAAIAVIFGFARLLR